MCSILGPSPDAYKRVSVRGALLDLLSRNFEDSCLLLPTFQVFTPRVIFIHPMLAALLHPYPGWMWQTFPCPSGAIIYQDLSASPLGCQQFFPIQHHPQSSSPTSGSRIGPTVEPPPMTGHQPDVTPSTTTLWAWPSNLLSAIVL